MKSITIQYHEQLGVSFSIATPQIKTPELDWSCLVSLEVVEQFPALTRATIELINLYGSDLIVGLIQELSDSEANHWLFETKEHAIQVLSLTLSLITNTEMALLNNTYRNKDKATDVLSFPGITKETLQLLHVPEIELGEIYISIPWAAEETQQPCNTVECLTPQYKQFVCDRFLHGLLHLLGKHHDTMDDYTWVRKTQDNVLASVLYK